MNGYQRYQNMLAGKPVDHLPRIPIVMQFAAEYINSDYGQFASDYQVLVRSNQACVNDFDFDQLSVICDPYCEASGFGAKVEYVSNGPPLCYHAPLEDTRDFSVLQTPDPVHSVRMRARVAAIEKYKQENDREYSIMGWVEGPAAEGADLRGLTNYLMDVIDDPPYACDLMDRCIEVGIAFAQAQVDAGADTIGVGDAIASQISPDLYETYILPREQKMVQAIKAMGAHVRLHICGNTTHLLDGINTLPIDIMDVDYLVDIQKVREKLGDKVALAGNLNPATTILHGTPDEIREAVRQIYEQVGNPLMIAAGCEIPSQTPHENLRALCEPLSYVV